MSIKCESENCFKNMGGECIAGGIVNDILCEEMKVPPLKNMPHCPECGSNFDPSFKGKKGECPQCDKENYFYN